MTSLYLSRTRSLNPIRLTGNTYTYNCTGGTFDAQPKYTWAWPEGNLLIDNDTEASHRMGTSADIRTKGGVLGRAVSAQCDVIGMYRLGYISTHVIAVKNTPLTTLTTEQFNKSQCCSRFTIILQTDISSCCVGLVQIFRPWFGEGVPFPWWRANGSHMHAFGKNVNALWRTHRCLLPYVTPSTSQGHRFEKTKLEVAN